MTSVGIVGASGYTGVELLRLCAGHPQFDVKLATADTQAGTRIADLYPSLSAAYGETSFASYESADAVDGLDLVFLGLPHGGSQTIVPDLLGRVGHVVDLGADFRLDDPGLYPQWYGAEHSCPELLPEFAYGLPELFRGAIRRATHVAAPGCYVTTSVLALAPLLRAGVVEPTGIVVDAASGVSGAGRPPKPHTTFCAVDEDFTAYGLLTHRHTPEMEQALTAVAAGAAAGQANDPTASDTGEGRRAPPGAGAAGAAAPAADRSPSARQPAGSTSPEADPGRSGATGGAPAGAAGVQVLFTPHLAPMNRGILATCYARPTGDDIPTTEELRALLRETWAGEPFVVVRDTSPSTKATLGSNTAHVTALADPRTGWVVAIAALDNLVKGASGQAIQCANLLCDLPETTGLPTIGLHP